MELLFIVCFLLYFCFQIALKTARQKKHQDGRAPGQINCESHLYTWLESEPCMWLVICKNISNQVWEMKVNSKLLLQVCLGSRAVPSTIIGGVYIHIFVFCPMDFFWERLFLRYVNMNIWIYTPPPQLSHLGTTLLWRKVGRDRLFDIVLQIINQMLGSDSEPIKYGSEIRNRFVQRLFGISFVLPFFKSFRIKTITKFENYWHCTILWKIGRNKLIIIIIIVFLHMILHACWQPQICYQYT
jgi:hypothetical protein